jgi:hypothetical protein
MFARYLRYEHRIATAFFAGGFLVDIVIFTAIDITLKNIIIGGYLTLAAGSIFLFQDLDRREETKRRALIKAALPFLIQFSFGAAMSGLLVYYFQSASLATSWLFLGILFGMIAGNEFIRSRYVRLEFQILVWFMCLLAFMVVLVPSLAGTIGKTVFLTSVVAAFGIGLASFALLARMTKTVALRERKFIMLGMSAISLLLILLYFARIIPPIPLILVERAIVHDLVRTTEGAYVARIEPRSWWEELFRLTPTEHFKEGEPVYFFSAISAPTELSAPLVHQWQYKSKKRGEWTNDLRITFPIVGGRDLGYRAYSQKFTATEGEWRILVTTNEGHTLGIHRFNITHGTPSALTALTR